MINLEIIDLVKDLYVVDILEVSMNNKGFRIVYEVLDSTSNTTTSFKLTFTGVRVCSINQWIKVDWGEGSGFYEVKFKKFNEVIDDLLQSANKIRYREIVKLESSLLDELYYFELICEYFYIDICFQDIIIEQIDLSYSPPNYCPEDNNSSPQDNTCVKKKP